MFGLEISFDIYVDDFRKDCYLIQKFNAMT